MSIINIATLDLASIPKDEVFLIDTNVLHFLHTDYHQKNTHSGDYSIFVMDLISSDIKVYTTSGNLQELLNKIIRTEETLYAKNFKRDHPRAKAFKKLARRDRETRERIQAIVASTTQQIYNTYTVLQTNLPCKTIDDYIDNFEDLQYDMMDCFIAQTAFENNIHNIITADMDFQCDSRFDIYCFQDE